MTLKRAELRHKWTGSGLAKNYYCVVAVKESR
jgi:hypothetical protein